MLAIIITTRMCNRITTITIIATILVTMIVVKIEEESFGNPSPKIRTPKVYDARRVLILGLRLTQLLRQKP